MSPIGKSVAVTAASYGMLAFLGYLLYKRAKATGALDPSSPNNLAYSAANAFGASLTGNQNFNFGAWIGEIVLPSSILDAESGNYSGTAPPGYTWMTTPSGARTLVPNASVASFTAQGFAADQAPSTINATWDARDYQNAQANDIATQNEAAYRAAMNGIPHKCANGCDEIIDVQ